MTAPTTAHTDRDAEARERRRLGELDVALHRITLPHKGRVSQYERKVAALGTVASDADTAARIGHARELARYAGLLLDAEHSLGVANLAVDSTRAVAGEWCRELRAAGGHAPILATPCADCLGKALDAGLRAVGPGATTVGADALAAADAADAA